jgi:hypothetical protein
MVEKIVSGETAESEATKTDEGKDSITEVRGATRIRLSRK